MVPPVETGSHSRVALVAETKADPSLERVLRRVKMGWSGGRGYCTSR